MRRRPRRPRLSLALCCALLGLLALAAPAVTFADGSAGDQQYTDPFAGSGSATAPHTSTAPHTQSAPAPASSTPAPAPAPATSAPAPSTSAAPTTTVAPSTSTGPLATVAGASAEQTLPYTGYEDWTVAGFGVTLLAGGLILRRRAAPTR